MAEIRDPENTLVVGLKDGEVLIEMLPDVAPKHVEQIKALARGGEYDNVAFHRVIDGFMAQTGDVANGDMEDGFNLSRAGTGGSSHPNLPAGRAGAARVPRARPHPPGAAAGRPARRLHHPPRRLPPQARDRRAWPGAAGGGATAVVRRPATP